MLGRGTATGAAVVGSAVARRCGWGWGLGSRASVSSRVGLLSASELGRLQDNNRHRWDSSSHHRMEGLWSLARRAMSSSAREEELDPDAKLFGRSRRRRRLKTPMPSATEKDEEPQTPTRVVEIKKKYFRNLLRKVHPDFYHNHPEYRKINEESLQFLHSLVEIDDKIIELGQELHYGPQGNDIEEFIVQLHKKKSGEIEFYLRSSKKEQSKENKDEQGEEFAQIVATLNLSTVSNTLNSAAEDRRPLLFEQFQHAVNRFLIDIYKQSGISVSNGHLRYFRIAPEKSAESMKLNKIQKEEQERERLAEGNPNTLQQLQREDQFDIKLTHPVLEKMFTPAQAAAAHALFLFDAYKDFIICDPMISPLEKEVAMLNLGRNLGSLAYYRWCEIPIYVMPPHLKPTDCTIKGVVPFPTRFKVSEMRQFLIDNLPRIKEERDQIEMLSEELRKLTTRARAMLGIADLSVSGSTEPQILLKEVQNFEKVIEPLFKNNSELYKRVFADVRVLLHVPLTPKSPKVLEFDDATGTMRFPSSVMYDAEMLHNFVIKNEERICKWRRGQFLDSIHLKALIDRVHEIQTKLGIQVKFLKGGTEVKNEPAALEAQKERQLRSLESIEKGVHRLQKLGMDKMDITQLIISDKDDDYQLSFSKGIVTLPPNFEYQKFQSFIAEELKVKRLEAQKIVETKRLGRDPSQPSKLLESSS